jgi:hypothetical protein
LVTPEKKAACHSILDACTGQPVAALFRHYPACFSTIGSNSDKSDGNTLHLIHKNSFSPGFVATLLMLVGSLAACQEPVPEPGPEPAAEATSALESTCGNVGSLVGTLSGAINVELNWLDDELRCESMLRPDSGGVRLRFSAEVSGERLAIIMALPALDAGATGDGFDSNVTLTVENSGRFFSTPNLDTCWADIAKNEPLPPRAGTFIVAGSLSCVAPLGEVNGDAFVDVRDLRFSGVAVWSSQ